LAKAVKTAKRVQAAKSLTFDLQVCKNGVLKKEVRRMARALVKAGCGQEHVDHVIRQICSGVGVTVVGNISRRTVARAILEGGIAADIQSAHELVVCDL
jgi:hypothetical protein